MWISRQEYAELEKRVSALEKIEQERKRDDEVKVDGLIKVVERRFPNQDYDQVKVSFEVPFHDWCLLRASTEWKSVELRLAGIRRKDKELK